ncbi:hypothetical protein JVU11DRAFT_12671 [Chiua virens]|nr:hypothetical protein JVU11DRAFT_12671 [Chiua virens]
MGEYDSTIGCLLIGVFINTFLYGLVTYQFAAYYWRKFNDRLVIRLMVFFLFALDTFYSAALIYMAYYYTVTNYGKPDALERGVWPYPLSPLTTALAAVVTQVYLGIRRLTGSRFLCGIVIVLAIPTAILGMVISIESMVITVISELPRLTRMVIVWLCLQVAIDAFITTTLVIIFVRWRGGFRRTDNVINRLIRGAIQTGLFAGIFSLGDLIAFAAAPKMYLYSTFAFPIGRIYTNTLMDTLLTRDTIKAEMDATYEMNRPSAAIAWLSVDVEGSGITSSSHTIKVPNVGDVSDGSPKNSERVECKHVALAV